MKKPKAPDFYASLEVEGNNGGSYVRIEREDNSGDVFLEVGESCVRTVSQKISVVALAGFVTRAKDIGFRKMLEDLHWDGEWLDRWAPKP